MKKRVVDALETLFTFTVGPVLILLFSPKLKKARIGVLLGGGAVATAWWTGLVFWVLGAAVGFIPSEWLGGPLTADERHILERTLGESVDEDHPVYQHSLRTEQRGRAYARLEGAHEGAVAAAALLHDATLEHPAIPPEQRFCVHGVAGGVISLRVLRQLEGRGGAFAVVVSDAVWRHVGPCGYNWEWQDKRWATKACDRVMPRPSSRVSRVLYDVATLDELTVDHVVRRAERRWAETPRTPLQEIVRTGKDSVLKEVSDAVQTLQTRSGKACGRQLARHGSSFIKALDFSRVKSTADLRAAADQFLARAPTPLCLDKPTAALLDDADADVDGDSSPTSAGPEAP